MWALAELVKREERRRWMKHFGTEFSGESEGRRVRLEWHERVAGHVCCGDIQRFGHLKCQQLVQMEWVFVRSKK